MCADRQNKPANEHTRESPIQFWKSTTRLFGCNYLLVYKNYPYVDSSGNAHIVAVMSSPISRHRRLPVRRIALLFEESGQGGVRLRGVVRYAREKPDWQLYSMNSIQPGELQQLAKRRIDGVITTIFASITDFAQFTTSVVNIIPLDDPNIVTVCPDESAVGRLAAQYLADRGLVHLLYVGIGEVKSYTDFLRAEAFQAEARRLGRNVVTFDGFRLWWLSEQEEQMRRISRFLKRQPRPLGIWCFNDSLGECILRAARQAGLSVPKDVAVLGTDNDSIRCGIASPSLSSIDLGEEQVGYQAASRLDDLISARPNVPVQTLLPPIGVIERQSTDVLRFEDADVVHALRYIREHGCEAHMNAEAVIRRVNLSRSGLHRKFVSLLGRSVAEEIWRVRIEHAKRLLMETDWTLRRISSETGFSTLEHLCRLFKANIGMTPKQYRHQRLLPRLPT
jgi:LacI family transcriptional regulator